MLAAYGIRTVVLDGAEGPAGHSRAAVVHARTLETLEPIGIVDEAVRRGVVVPYFAIRDRDRRLLAVPFDKLPTVHPYTLMLPQDETEHLLRGALRHQGEEILWGHEVTEVRQDATGVDLSVRSPQGDKRVRTRFVVGCDGARGILDGLGPSPYRANLEEAIRKYTRALDSREWDALAASDTEAPDTLC